MKEYKVQSDGRVSASSLSGEKVVVKKGTSIILHGYEVRKSGYIGVGKEYAGEKVKLIPLEEYEDKQ
jgi:hypothetical protein